MPELGNVLAAATARLGERVDAEVLLLHVLGKPRSWLFSHADDVLDSDVTRAFDSLVERRARGEPVAYITGSCGFWSLLLEVTPATLIPRPETELLVELALARLPRDGAYRVVDLGTGSGAVALAIASERPQAQVIAIDASADALAVARGNARKNGIGNVSFRCGDWLSPLGDERVELIVSNPPYIESDDPHLDRGDLRFEPLAALVSGGDGLDDIRRIIDGACRHLRPQGWLLLEHGWQQGDAVRALLRNAGYAEVFTAEDLERRDRISGGCR